MLLLVLSGGSAAAAEYSHRINDAGWQARTSRFECLLVNQVPFYGEAVFRRVAGVSESEFVLEAPTARFAQGQAALIAVAPVWKPELGRVVLGEVPVEQGETPVKVGQEYAEAILAQLLEGREVVIARETWYAEGKARLALSSVAFRKAYGEYLNCITQLLPASYEQLHRTALYFSPGENEELPQAAVQKLDQILRYAEADPYLKELYIDGHTDSTGTREQNLALSEQRTQLVTDYLVKRGMPKDRIIMRWHGERYPVVANDSSASRAKNRRVTLRLERVEPYDIPPLAASLREQP